MSMNGRSLARLDIRQVVGATEIATATASTGIGGTAKNAVHSTARFASISLPGAADRTQDVGSWNRVPTGRFSQPARHATAPQLEETVGWSRDGLRVTPPGRTNDEP
jgi:hypothetical protein